ncbi:hypothetical protein NLJ89_g5799 [Agrocybe chaxingu]|uniref:Uncharacterized protein n=1 Tax=Agrocybe chaxingu TaxID=84603 RepID=A0A9W8K037_9AGAR|nr:hypothetical protein NLJ89_g5799 [Agrocybe chaxingu]
MLFRSSIVALFALIGASLAQDASVADVKAAFDTARIPTSLNLAFEPTALLTVSFPQPNGTPVVLTTGARIPRASTAGPPQYRVNGTTTPGPFVIAMVRPRCPDAPIPHLVPDPTLPRRRVEREQRCRPWGAYDDDSSSDGVVPALAFWDRCPSIRVSVVQPIS